MSQRSRDDESRLLGSVATLTTASEVLMAPAGDLDTEPSRPKRLRTGRYLSGVRGLIALVACCGLAMWAGRVAWVYKDPVVSADREIQARAIRASNRKRRRIEWLRFAISSTSMLSIKRSQLLR